ncbi:hypothetical protein [Variovorax sp. 38R]|uniref:hypothetical protein n=1 Tax=Variovorax sp. 38R TaxID=2774875 RepID=UPI00177B3A27|nr:hypothetical protein [Variovorax sp. 38R]QOF81433.1 hypothetical protein IG196_14110 [Variovorax sp. 38R]
MADFNDRSVAALFDQSAMFTSHPSTCRCQKKLHPKIGMRTNAFLCEAENKFSGEMHTEALTLGAS